MIRSIQLIRKELPSYTELIKRIVLYSFAALLVLGFSFNEAQAQQTEISGTVTDAEDGSPLPSVNITVQGTTIGTSTDLNGQYSLEVPADADSLVYSFVGYLSITEPIDGRTEINISLQPDVRMLEDVVVVGYGTQQRKQITGSVSSVRAEDFVSGNVNTATELIQGKVPGLTVTNQGGGDPNSDPTVRLRGISSFGANQEPLVVVDGVLGGSLDNIDPNDIASIEVLKDASASAIYGTRGSAGVILVTTKSGERGPEGQSVSVNYNGFVTIEGIENQLDVLNANEFRQLAVDFREVHDLEENEFDIFDGQTSTNWYDLITQTGSNNVHNLSLSGGGENSVYRVSGNYRDRTGIQKQTGFEQLSGRVNLQQWALDNRLKFTLNLGATNRQEDQGLAIGEEGPFEFATTFNPTLPVRADGFETTGGFFEQPLFRFLNPVAIIETGDRTFERDNFNGSLRADYEFEQLIPNLSASAFYSLETTNSLFREFFAKTSKFGGGATETDLGPGQAQRVDNRSSSELFEATVNYLADVDQLRIETIAGYSWQNFIDETTVASGGDFITDVVGFNNLSFAQDFSQGEGTVGSFKGENRLIGFFGRANLNWDDTYFINGSYRREASSRFGADNRWGDFWAAGAGVEVTNLVELPFFERFRLRGSFGVTGQDAPENGLAVQRFEPSGNFFVNGEFVQSFSPASNPNPDLKWEEKRELNLGFDFEAVDSRLTGTFEYFNKVTDDLLFQVAVPVPPNLFPTTWRNVGELETNGFEAALDLEVIRQNNLTWSSGFTFSTFETILEEFVTDETQFISNAGSPGQNDRPLIRVQEGRPIGEIFGPEFAEIGPDGGWLFFDRNGNKVSPDEITREDERVIGNGLPDFELGWNNSVNWRNWDFNTFFRGAFGHDLVNTFRLFYEAPNQITAYNVLSSALDLTELREAPQFSSFQVEDASFVRLQNASLGYTIPFSEATSIRRLRLYVSANNLFTITGYDGIDPEVRFTDPIDDDNPLAPGIERRNQWFTARSVSVGINLDF